MSGRDIYVEPVHPDVRVLGVRKIAIDLRPLPRPGERAFDHDVLSALNADSSNLVCQLH